MSLVAYAGSSEDEVSDQELDLDDVAGAATSTAIEVEDAWELGASSKPVGHGSSLFAALPLPISVKKHELPEEEDPLPEVSEDVSMKSSLVPRSSSDNAEPDLISEDQKSRSLLLPSPVNRGPQRSGPRKAPVQITIPSLRELASDSDDDEDKPNLSHGAKKGSSLFGVLPKPKHSVVVGSNANKPLAKQANRLLIPHSLAKRPEPPKAKEGGAQRKAVKSDSVDQAQHKNESDEDDEHESADSARQGDFFSLDPQDVAGSAANSKETAAESTFDEISEPITRDASVLPVRVNSSKVSADVGGSSIGESGSLKSNLPSLKTQKSSLASIHLGSSSRSLEPRTLNNAKEVTGLHRESYVTGPYPGAQVGSVLSSFQGDSAQERAFLSGNRSLLDSHGIAVGDVTGPYSGTYALPSSSGTRFPSVASVSVQPSSAGAPSFGYPRPGKIYNAVDQQKDAPGWNSSMDTSVGMSGTLDDEALRQLQGGKRKKEQVTIIDVHADDFSQTSTDLLKQITEESTHKVKKPKHEMPSSKEKRKHQITYLAFQAKEREFELQQAWAESRLTKRQTQSKYGF